MQKVIEATTKLSFKHHKALTAYIGNRSDAITTKRERRKADLLAALAHFTNIKTMECWPSQSSLASMAGISIRTVKTYCDELVKEGVLFVTSRKHLNKSNLFKINLPQLADWFCRRTVIPNGITRENTTGMTSIDEVVADAIKDQIVVAKAKSLARTFLNSFFNKKRQPKPKNEVAPPEQPQEWAVNEPVERGSFDVSALRKSFFGRTTRIKRGRRN